MLTLHKLLDETEQRIHPILADEIPMNKVAHEAIARPLGRVVINRKQLMQKVPLCERTILDMEKRGEFPRRFSVTPRLVVWDLAEVDDWIARQQSAGVQQPPPAAKPR